MCEGRVEVCLNNEWGSVCATSWDVNDAIVVSQQINGFIVNGKQDYTLQLCSYAISNETLIDSDVVAYTSAEIGTGSGRIFLISVACRGDERRLIDCSSTAASCTSPVAGVGCSGLFSIIYTKWKKFHAK